MAATNKALDITAESKDITLNKKIAELKKKILLAEGQKKALAEEWEQTEKKCKESIAELKKDIKELTGRLVNFISASIGKYTSETCETIRTVKYPQGAETAEKALEMYDLKIINLTKQCDLLDARYTQRKEEFNKLLKIKAEVSSSNDDPALDQTDSNECKTKSIAKAAVSATQSLTVEEDRNRKMVCQLENEILRINVQWSQAEHIRKKYKSIKSSLMNDAEKFEKSLMELESSFKQQQTDIEDMKEIHREAVQMRDAAKIILMRQEHYAQTSKKTRAKQAFDFRQQVEEHKVELERLERKLLTASKTSVMQQGSTESLSGDAQLTEKASPLSADKGAPDIANQLENHLKILMTVTGATNPLDVLNRFSSQKDASTRLNYLRTITEGEKRHLEAERDSLSAQLESSKYSDSKESEVNQEHLETLKNSICDQQKKEYEFLQAANRSKIVLNSIKLTIIDLVLKLQEIDVATDMVDDAVNENMPNGILLQLLEDRLKQGLLLTGDLVGDEDSGLEADETIDDQEYFDGKPIDGSEHLKFNLKLNELQVPPMPSSANPTPRSQGNPDANQTSTHDMDRPTPYPTCYASLLAGRTTGVSTSASPGQTIQQVATDDEAEVPSRSLLKRQALIIIDTKARRKGFRAQPKRK